jgi:SAM-dependent methyltransferase
MTGMETSQWQRCPVCKGDESEKLLNLSQVPVFCNLLFSNKAEAMAIKKGQIHLGYCKTCEHIYNLVFDPQLLEYDQSYENALDFSPTFQSYAESLARALVEKFNLYNKKIVEIGCGQGNFLQLLCDFGGNIGVGFDPSYVLKPATSTIKDNIKIIPDYYSEKYSDIEADFICSRHVLEHLSAPIELLDTIRKAYEGQDSKPLYFEVPNVRFTVRDLAIWDIIYEHYSFFSPRSLNRLFTDGNFDVLEVRETFSNQFLSIEAYSSKSPDDLSINRETSLESISPDVLDFPDRFNNKLDYWNNSLGELKADGKRVVVWGAGSKGVTFLNLINHPDLIEYVVDINPRKQGMYISGSGQKIVPPDFLKPFRPQVVVIMNNIYKNEIEMLIQELGLYPEYLEA